MDTLRDSAYSVVPTVIAKVPGTTRTPPPSMRSGIKCANASLRDGLRPHLTPSLFCSAMGSGRGLANEQNPDSPHVPEATQPVTVRNRTEPIGQFRSALRRRPARSSPGTSPERRSVTPLGVFPLAIVHSSSYPTS